MQPLLEVSHLKSSFKTPNGLVDVVADVSFAIAAGEAVGIVGESGSGKTMTGLSILDLMPRPAGRIRDGRILFNGEDILKMPQSRRRRLRGGRISMIFQDPMSSLSPFYTVGYQIAEAIRWHQASTRHEAQRKAVQLMEDVGLPDAARRAKQFPHQFSGGMRQRIMIAMALANEPELLIADEPTTALDVTIQAQILALLADRIQKRRNMSLLLISHNWGVISSLCDRVLVMYAGRIVEEGSAADVYANPRHPYTQGLLRAIPRWDSPKNEPLAVIPGQAPAPRNDREGCAFADRCSQVSSRCRTSLPPARELDGRHVYWCIHE